MWGLIIFLTFVVIGIHFFVIEKCIEAICEGTFGVWPVLWLSVGILAVCMCSGSMAIQLGLSRSLGEGISYITLLCYFARIYREAYP